jgi:hypothetical protein
MSLIALPTGLRPATVTLMLRAFQRVNAAPSGGSEQAVDLQNDRWAMSLTFPARSQVDSAAFEAWLASMRGMVNTVALWHFARPVPRGTMRGSPTLNGAHNAGVASIAITGGTAGSTLLAGDLLGLGGLLIMVAADVTLNGSGAGTVTLANRLRVAQSSGAAITWNKPTAPFRMATPGVGITYSPGMGEAVSLDLLEAI